MIPTAQQTLLGSACSIIGLSTNQNGTAQRNEASAFLRRSANAQSLRPRRIFASCRRIGQPLGRTGQIKEIIHDVY